MIFRIFLSGDKEVSMSSINLAIICDGKEISYGMNLFHLFYYKNEKDHFASGKYDDLSIEMYSFAAFHHANISKKTAKIYVGSVQCIDTCYKKVFDKLGMAIYQKENDYVLKVDDNQMNSYSEFISYANEKRNEYIKVEKEYFIKVGTLDANWIVSEFTKSNSGGLFKKKNTIVQQLYDCLSFVAYLDFLENIK